MTEKELIKQLKSLKNHKQAGALGKERADLMYKNLMSRVDEDLKLNPAAYSPKLWFLRGFGLNNCFRFAVTICMVFAIGIVGCFTAVSASFNSLPGDTLYTIKLTAERIQIALTQDEAMKIDLRAEFAGRRIEEMTQIISSSLEDKGDRIEQAFSDFSDSLEGFDNSNQIATGTVKIINQKIDELNEIIVRNAPELSDNIKNVTNDISGVMISLSIPETDNTATSSQEFQELPEPVLKPIPQPEVFPEISEAPKKIQWQIIIEE